MNATCEESKYLLKIVGSLKDVGNMCNYMRNELQALLGNMFASFRASKDDDVIQCIALTLPRGQPDSLRHAGTRARRELCRSDRRLPRARAMVHVGSTNGDSLC